MRQAVKISGIDGIALTKLDILDGFDEIKVCVGYRLDGERDRPPAGVASRSGAASSRSTRSIEGWTGVDRRARAPGPICRRRRSNMFGGSRN